MKRDALQFAGWIILLYVAMAIVFAGCMPPNESSDEKQDQKQDQKRDGQPDPANVSPVAKAASQGIAAYRSAAADVCKSLHDRAGSGEFTKWADFEKAWEQENYQARVKSFGPYAEAINDQLFTRGADGSWKTDGPIDVPKLQKVLREAEEGFRGK